MAVIAECKLGFKILKDQFVRRVGWSEGRKGSS